MEPVKILVVGAGAVGIYFGSRLARGGACVSLVARGDYEIASRRGYEIRTLNEKYHFTPASVVRHSGEYPDIPDYVILTTKCLPEVDAVSMLQPVVGKKTTIMLIQNGIGIEDKIAAAFPKNDLISTIAYISASRPEPGVMLNEGVGKLKAGCFPSGISESARRLAGIFAAGGTDCELFEEISQVRWYKLLWNLAFNVVSVLARAETDRMSDGGELEKLCRRLMKETRAVAASCSIRLTEKDIEDNFAFTRSILPFKTSTYQDYLAGRKMEVEPILGNAMRIGRKNAVPVPTMEVCYALLDALNNQQKR